MPLPHNVAAMQDALLRHLATSERGFRLGAASDTQKHGYNLSESDAAIILAYRALVCAGQVTETKTHMRSSGAYTSIYRLTELGREQVEATVGS